MDTIHVFFWIWLKSLYDFWDMEIIHLVYVFTSIFPSWNMFLHSLIWFYCLCGKSFWSHPCLLIYILSDGLNNLQLVAHIAAWPVAPVWPPAMHLGMKQMQQMVVLRRVAWHSIQPHVLKAKQAGLEQFTVDCIKGGMRVQVDEWTRLCLHQRVY